MIFNMTGGGGGGGIHLGDAIIRVEANTGSTVTATDGVNTLTSEELTVTGYSYGFFFFSIPSGSFGTWTVTCISSGQTLTKTVSVSAPFEYICSFVRLYLYSHGNEFSSTTGGWAGYAESKEGTNWARQVPVVTNYSDYLSIIFAITSGYHSGYARIANTVDISSYTKLCIDYDLSSTGSSFSAALTATTSTSNHYTPAITSGLSKGTNQSAEIDITSVRSNLMYWGFDFHDNGGTRTTTLTIHAMWFE